MPSIAAQVPAPRRPETINYRTMRRIPRGRWNEWLLFAEATGADSVPVLVPRRPGNDRRVITWGPRRIHLRINGVSTRCTGTPFSDDMLTVLVPAWALRSIYGFPARLAPEPPPEPVRRSWHEELMDEEPKPLLSDHLEIADLPPGYAHPLMTDDD